MKLSKQGEYGLRAVLYFAAHKAEGWLKVKTIAEQEGISVKFLEQIMLRLRKAGLLISQKGANGGYRLAKPADQMTLAEIVRAIEGAISPMMDGAHLQRLIERADTHCGLYTVLMKVRNAIVDILEKTTLRDVTKMTQECQERKRGVLVYQI